MMCKRLQLSCLVVLIVFVCVPLAQASSDCDRIDSPYVRAVQMHDMGDYAEALRYYQCALEADPDDAVIPILIDNLHDDIANAERAWASEDSESTAEILQLPPVSTWGQAQRPELPQDFEDLVVVEPQEEAGPEADDSLWRIPSEWQKLGEYSLPLEQLQFSYGVEKQIGLRQYMVAAIEEADGRAELRPMLQGRDYRVAATYWYSISYSKLNRSGVAMVLPDDVAADGPDGLPLVTSHVYAGHGYDVLVMLRLYQWASQAETLGGEPVIGVDVGAGYQLTTSVSAWSSRGMRVESHLRDRAPFDPNGGPDVFGLARGQRQTLTQTVGAEVRAVGLFRPAMDPAEEFIRRARMFADNLDWTRAKLNYEKALELGREDIRCELGAVYAALGEDEGEDCAPSTAGQFDF